jgi:hypothetical protein
MVAPHQARDKNDHHWILAELPEEGYQRMVPRLEEDPLKQRQVSLKKNN